MREVRVMIEAMVVLSLFALILLAVAMKRKDGSSKKALRSGLAMMKGVIPLLLFAFILSGMLQAAIPAELIKQWLGSEAGLRGIVIGTLAGTSIPGGPYISFPIISAVHDAGAGIGTVVAFVTGWAMMGLGKLPFELAIMGTRFTLVRMLLFAIFPVIAGWIAYAVL